MEKSLFFLHGWSFDSSVWKKQKEFFNDRFHVLSLDLPGHGESLDKCRIDILEDVTHAIEGFRVISGDIVFVGHSFGGLLGLKLAQKNSYLFNKIVLISSSACFLENEDYPGLTNDQISKLNGLLDNNYPDALKVFYRWLFSASERSDASFRSYWKLVVNRKRWPVKEALAEYLSWIEREDLRNSLEKIACQVLIIHGEDDPLCPKSSGEYLEKHLKHARLVTLKGAGHLPFLTRAQEVNQLIQEFILEI